MIKLAWLLYGLDMVPSYSVSQPRGAWQVQTLVEIYLWEHRAEEFAALCTGGGVRLIRELAGMKSGESTEKMIRFRLTVHFGVSYLYPLHGAQPHY